MTRVPIEDWQTPVLTGWGPFLHERSRNGFGQSLSIGRRVRLYSPNAAPDTHRGTDEHCNRAVTIRFWRLGGITVWWEPHRRTEPCLDCIIKHGARPGFCCAEHRRMFEPTPVCCPGPGCGHLIAYRWDDATGDWRLDAYQAAHGPEYGCSRACMVRAALANDRAARRGAR